MLPGTAVWASEPHAQAPASGRAPAVGAGGRARPVSAQTPCHIAGQCASLQLKPWGKVRKGRNGTTSLAGLGPMSFRNSPLCKKLIHGQLLALSPARARFFLPFLLLLRAGWSKKGGPRAIMLRPSRIVLHAGCTIDIAFRGLGICQFMAFQLSSSSSQGTQGR